MTDKTASRLRTWMTPAIIIIVAVLLIVVVVTQGIDDRPSTDQTPSESKAQVEQPELSDIERRDPDDLLAFGPLDAPVGLVVYSDYQCPFCAAWNQDTLPELMPYVESGQLRIEWRDVNVFGPASERAARAAYAAAIQNRYWDYHDALFPEGEHLPESKLTGEAPIGLADELGLDVEQFAADMSSNEAMEEAQHNEQEGRDLGVTGTPAFILGGQPMIGAQPTQAFLDALDTALAEAED